jgi:hypothetical protein
MPGGGAELTDADRAQEVAASTTSNGRTDDVLHFIPLPAPCSPSYDSPFSFKELRQQFPALVCQYTTAHFRPVIESRVAQ